MNKDISITTQALLIGLCEFDKFEIAALNLAVIAFGRVSKVSFAYDKARFFEIINDEGTIYPEFKPHLAEAIALDIKRRQTEKAQQPPQQPSLDAI